MSPTIESGKVALTAAEMFRILQRARDFLGLARFSGPCVKKVEIIETAGTAYSAT